VGAEVIGISGDDAVSHKAFAKKYRLPFTLLSDEGNKVRKEWGGAVGPVPDTAGEADLHPRRSFFTYRWH
jgi:peroxiredoxin